MSTVKSQSKIQSVGITESNETDSILMISCVSGYFLGAACGRDAAEMVAGNKLSEEDWKKYGSLWDEGWDKMLLEGEHIKTEKKMKRKEAQENIASFLSLLDQATESTKTGLTKGQQKLKGLLPTGLPKVNKNYNAEQVTERLNQLGILQSEGIITESEYAEQRQRILSSI